MADKTGAVSVIHIGRRVPKGWVELPGAMHLGKGMWMFRMKPGNPTVGLMEAFLNKREMEKAARRNSAEIVGFGGK